MNCIYLFYLLLYCIVPKSLPELFQVFNVFFFNFDVLR